MTALRQFRFAPAPPQLARSGLLGWASFEIGDLWRVEGVAVRRTLGGRLALSFPARVDRRGVEHPYVQPKSERGRRAVEQAVLAELGLVSSGLPPPVEEPREIPRPSPRCPRGDAPAADERADEARSDLSLGGDLHDGTFAPGGGAW